MTSRGEFHLFYGPTLWGRLRGAILVRSGSFGSSGDGGGGGRSVRAAVGLAVYAGVAVAHRGTVPGQGAEAVRRVIGEPGALLFVLALEEARIRVARHVGGQKGALALAGLEAD